VLSLRLMPARSKVRVRHFCSPNRAIMISSYSVNFMVRPKFQRCFEICGRSFGRLDIAMWPPKSALGRRDIWRSARAATQGPIEGLWTRDQAATVRQFAAPNEPVLWGCDIEEGQPERLILNMAALNPEDAELQQMVKITDHGYKRKQAPELLHLAEGVHPVHDAMVGGISLWQNLRDTLRIETLRSRPGTKLTASEARELVMKQLFPTIGRKPRVRSWYASAAIISIVVMTRAVSLRLATLSPNGRSPRTTRSSMLAFSPQAARSIWLARPSMPTSAEMSPPSLCSLVLPEQMRRCLTFGCSGHCSTPSRAKNERH
jgi:hypothetical protein